MKILKIISLLFIFINCEKLSNEHMAIGTWNRCDKDGTYSEYKITDNYLINISTASDEIWIYKIRIINNKLIVSELENGPGLIINNDTLIINSFLKNKLILKSTFTKDKLELNKVNIHFDEIDSTNIELWKKKTILKFKNRAFLAKCNDLRTDDEKKIEILNIKEDFKEEYVPLN